MQNLSAEYQDDMNKADTEWLRERAAETAFEWLIEFSRTGHVKAINKTTIDIYQERKKRKLGTVLETLEQLAFEKLDSISWSE